jgi:hypothetical protein
LRIATNLDGARCGNNTHQCAIRAEIAAPEVLDEDRENNEAGQNCESRQAQVAKEIEHLDVCNDGERRLKKSAQFRGRHGEYNEYEESEQKVFQGAQREIE